MDIEKLINTMADIIGERHRIRIRANVRDRTVFLPPKGEKQYEKAV